MEPDYKLVMSLKELGISDTERQIALKKMNGSDLLNYASRLLEEVDTYLARTKEKQRIVHLGMDRVEEVRRMWSELPLSEFIEWLADLELEIGKG